jgi:hypothetical protein
VFAANGLASELISFRNDRAKIGEPNHQIERDQQAGQTEYCDDEDLTLRVSQYGWPRSSLAWRLNAKRKGSRRGENDGKKKQ